MWGSEFTTKDTTFQGDSADFPARLNVQIGDMRGGGDWCGVRVENAGLQVEEARVRVAEDAGVRVEWPIAKLYKGGMELGHVE
jgi:hypothetical protein